MSRDIFGHEVVWGILWAVPAAIAVYLRHRTDLAVLRGIHGRTTPAYAIDAVGVLDVVDALLFVGFAAVGLAVGIYAGVFGEGRKLTQSADRGQLSNPHVPEVVSTVTVASIILYAHEHLDPIAIAAAVLSIVGVALGYKAATSKARDGGGPA